MSTLVVIGGTGYTGGNIVAEAAQRGHSVTSWSRNAPESPVVGVTYETGSLQDDENRQRAVAGADTVILALAPRGELENELAGIYARIAELAAASGARLGVVGGFSGLRPAEGAPRFAEGDDLPPQFAHEARVMTGVLETLLADAPEGLDWFFVSPAANYGSYAPGEKLGTYRTGGEVAVFDEKGESAVSGVDFATAIVDEIETPAHHGEQFGVAY